MGISVLPLLLLGCEGLPEEILYKRTDVPGVLDLGEMRPVATEEYWQTHWEKGSVVGAYGPEGGEGTDTTTDTWYDLVQTIGGEDSQGRRGVYYGEVGPGEKGTYGGITLNFRGTGTKVCVVVDPETVYWSQQRSADVSNSEYVYQDRLDDDGDLDTYAGLSAYYKIGRAHV
jgi:hypothetical protein